MNKRYLQKGFSALWILILILILMIIGGVGWYVSRSSEDDPVSTSETTEQDEETEPTPEDDSEDQTDSSDDELGTDETTEYTLTIPAGFERIAERQFTFIGTPETTYTYKNLETNDYFEVNINAAQSGINADFTWLYTYTDGSFAVDKSNSTVCTPEESDWCEFSGDNGRLDSAIFSEGGTGIDGESVYFTFGNTSSEVVGDLSYVDTFLENIAFTTE